MVKILLFFTFYFLNGYFIFEPSSRLRNILTGIYRDWQMLELRALFAATVFVAMVARKMAATVYLVRNFMFHWAFIYFLFSSEHRRPIIFVVVVYLERWWSSRKFLEFFKFIAKNRILS